MDVLAVGVDNDIIITITDVTVVDIHARRPNGDAIGVMRCAGLQIRRRLTDNDVMDGTVTALSATADSEVHAGRVLQCEITHEETAAIIETNQRGTRRAFLLHGTGTVDSCPPGSALSVNDRTVLILTFNDQVRGILLSTKEIVLVGITFLVYRILSHRQELQHGTLGEMEHGMRFHTDRSAEPCAGRHDDHASAIRHSVKGGLNGFCIIGGRCLRAIRCDINSICLRDGSDLRQGHGGPSFGRVLCCPLGRDITVGKRRSSNRQCEYSRKKCFVQHKKE